MKKLLAILLAALSAFSMTAIAYAENTTTLTTTVPDTTYTLNIPADQTVEFNETSKSIGMVTVTDAEGFSVGKNLKVTIDHGSFSSSSTDTTIPFVVGNAGVEVISILLFKGQSNGAVSDAYVSGYTALMCKDLRIKIADSAWGGALPGDYSATITFTAEVVIAE